MAEREQAVLAVDVGGTFFKSALVTTDGEIIKDSKIQEPVDSSGPADGIKRCLQNILKKQYIFAQNRFELLGIGIDTPGPFDFINMESRMQHKFKSIYGIPLKPWIQEIFDNVYIKFLHDSSAFLIGESWKGAAKEYGNSAGVMLGTGLGFAVMRNKNILQNCDGGPAVSIYNLPFKGKTAEEYVSRRGMISRYLSKSPYSQDIDVVDIAELAQKGDINAMQTFEETGQVLGEIISPILKRFDTECLVLGGQISKSFNLFRNALVAGLDGVNSLKKIDSSADIEGAHLLGCAAAILSGVNVNDIVRFEIFSG
ncbi:MAG: ROK family protein [Bacillota bacterium]|nr:ROK family protein [Bacillota bacterium]